MRRRQEKKSGCRFGDRIKKCFAKMRCSENDIQTPSSLSGCKGRVRVCKVNGDRQSCARMASMGLYPGVEADIICAEYGHQCLVRLHGGTISLDPAISENILVTSL